MGILTKNFPELDNQESQVASYTVPGFRGKLVILLSEQNVRFRQTGWCTTDQTTIDEINANKGDPTHSEDVDAYRHGIIEDCWKVSTQFEVPPPGEPSFLADGTKAMRYTIHWEQHGQIGS